MTSVSPDMIIVGGGLAGLLTAWRCVSEISDFNISILEAAEQIGGDHTWSFNLTDVDPFLQDWIAPFIAHQWPRYDVRFPKRQRTLDIAYATGHSESLRACLAPYIKSGRVNIRTLTRAREVNVREVILETGETLSAPYVIDARGYKADENVILGYQKFVGRTIRTKAPHGLKYPIIMDATVEQHGGYRFVYCLPFSDHEVLVEDTYYTDEAGLSDNEVVDRIENYIAQQGWEVEQLVRQERGVLPITLAVDQAEQTADQDADKDAGQAPKIGIRGGFYHAVTGYSFPDALRNAALMCQHIQAQRLKGEIFPIPVTSFYTAHVKRERYFRLLNRMLFRAAKPTERYKVLERFYGLSEPLVRRFYAGRLTLRDKMRILIGKPPVPISKAMYNLSEAEFIRRERNRTTDL